MLISMEIIAPSETFRLPLNDRNALDQSAAAETQAVCFQATDLPSLWSAHQWSLSIPSVPQITNCTHFFFLPLLQSSKSANSTKTSLNFSTLSPFHDFLSRLHNLPGLPCNGASWSLPGLSFCALYQVVNPLHSLLESYLFTISSICWWALTQRIQWKSSWGGGLSEGTEVCFREIIPQMHPLMQPLHLKINN